MPPLAGPLASLYWTLNPWKSFMEPSSMRTGKATCSSRLGDSEYGPGSGVKLQDVRALVYLSLCRLKWVVCLFLPPFRLSYGSYLP